MTNIQALLNFANRLGAMYMNLSKSDKQIWLGILELSNISWMRYMFVGRLKRLRDSMTCLMMYFSIVEYIFSLYLPNAVHLYLELNLRYELKLQKQ